MKKISLWLYLIGVGNLLFATDPVFGETDDGGLLYQLVVIFRVMFSGYVLWMAFEIQNLRIRGWYMLCGMFIFLTLMLFLSPLWIVYYDPPKDGLSKFMIFAGQWGGAALSIWAYRGWWLKQKSAFLGTMEEVSSDNPS